MKTNTNTRIRLEARFRLCGAFLHNSAWPDRLSKSAPHNVHRHRNFMWRATITSPTSISPFPRQPQVATFKRQCSIKGAFSTVSAVPPPRTGFRREVVKTLGGIIAFRSRISREASAAGGRDKTSQLVGRLLDIRVDGIVVPRNHLQSGAPTSPFSSQSDAPSDLRLKIGDNVKLW